MWWASRHEDVYQKYIHSTRARRGKTCSTALQTPTSMRTHYHASHAASAARRARRRRRRRQSSARRPSACRKVARRACRAGSRASTTCSREGGGKMTDPRRPTKGWPPRTVIEPRPLEAAAAPLARPAAGARVRNSKRMIWRASSLQAGSEQRAGRSRRGARSPTEAGGAVPRRWEAGDRSTEGRRTGAVSTRKLSSLPDLYLNCQLRTGGAVRGRRRRPPRRRPSAPRADLLQGGRDSGVGFEAPIFLLRMLCGVLILKGCRTSPKAAGEGFAVCGCASADAAHLALAHECWKMSDQ